MRSFSTPSLAHRSHLSSSRVCSLTWCRRTFSLQQPVKSYPAGAGSPAATDTSAAAVGAGGRRLQGRAELKQRTQRLMDTTQQAGSHGVALHFGHCMGCRCRCCFCCYWDAPSAAGGCCRPPAGGAPRLAIRANAAQEICAAAAIQRSAQLLGSCQTGARLGGVAGHAHQCLDAAAAERLLPVGLQQRWHAFADGS